MFQKLEFSSATSYLNDRFYLEHLGLNFLGLGLEDVLYFKTKVGIGQC